MAGHLRCIRCALTALLVAAGLGSCTDVPITSTGTWAARYPISSVAQVDSLPELPGEGVTPQGCAEDQQEAVVDPATGELIPCPIDPIVVVVPPADDPVPPPPPPPGEEPAPGTGGSPPPPDGSCDGSVDWDPDCPAPPPYCSYLISADNECIGPPGPDEQDVILDDPNAVAAPCPNTNENPLWYAHEVSDDPGGEMAHFRFERGQLSKTEDLGTNPFFSTAKYYNSRDILSEKTARWVLRPGFLKVRCTIKVRALLISRKSFFRLYLIPEGAYDGKVERVL